MTRDRQRELERSRLQAQLEQSERVNGLGRVAATIAHEINNVLMGISPFVEVLRKRLEDAVGVANAASHIAQSVQRGKRVTQDILRFTRAADPVLGTLNVCDLLERLVTSMAPALGDRVKVSVECRAGGRALADTAQMEQGFANLLINARDASSPTGAIEVIVDGATRDLMVSLGLPADDAAAFVHVALQDHGAGIAPDVIARIFERVSAAPGDLLNRSRR